MKKSLTHTVCFLAATCLLFGLLAAPSAADVKMVTQVESTGMAAAANGESTVYIKGLMMRSETTARGEQMVMLLDVENGRMVSLDVKKEKAEVFDLKGLQKQMEQFVDSSDVSVSLEPSGATETVAGETCNVHEMTVRVKVEMAPGSGMGATMVMDGTSCLVPDAPGAEDYERFYKAMAEKGMFLGDPRAAQGPGAGTQKGMAELYRAMAEKGMAYHSDLIMSFDASGMMAKMFDRFAFDTETTVTSVSTESLPDSLFEIPAGWKVKNVK